MPLDLLEERVNGWIESQSKGQKAGK
jgi:hypothetical protein